MHRRTIINSKYNDIFTSLTSIHENCERELNSMPQPLYLCLCVSAFLVSFFASNKKLPSVNSELNLLTMYVVCK